MDARLVIESEEAVRLAEELAALTGEDVTSAVVRALAERIGRQHPIPDDSLTVEEILELGRRCAARLRPPFHSGDHADLYGEDGLPA
jgi:antitoxin VapB